MQGVFPLTKNSCLGLYLGLGFAKVFYENSLNTRDINYELFAKNTDSNPPG